MRKTNKKSFGDLVLENKQALLRDPEAIDRIESKFEEKHEIKIAE